MDLEERNFGYFLAKSESRIASHYFKQGDIFEAIHHSYISLVFYTFIGMRKRAVNEESFLREMGLDTLLIERMKKVGERHSF